MKNVTKNLTEFIQKHVPQRHVTPKAFTGLLQLVEEEERRGFKNPEPNEEDELNIGFRQWAQKHIPNEIRIKECFYEWHIDGLVTELLGVIVSGMCDDGLEDIDEIRQIYFQK